MVKIQFFFLYVFLLQFMTNGKALSSAIIIKIIIVRTRNNLSMAEHQYFNRYKADNPPYLCGAARKGRRGQLSSSFHTNLGSCVETSVRNSMSVATSCPGGRLTWDILQKMTLVTIITEHEIIITIREIKNSLDQTGQQYKSYLRNSTIVCWMKWTNAGR